MNFIAAFFARRKAKKEAQEKALQECYDRLFDLQLRRSKEEMDAYRNEVIREIREELRKELKKREYAKSVTPEQVGVYARDRTKQTPPRTDIPNSSPPYERLPIRTASPSSSTRRDDSSSDLTNPANPLSPISPLNPGYWASTSDDNCKRTSHSGPSYESGTSHSSNNDSSPSPSDSSSSSGSGSD